MTSRSTRPATASAAPGTGTATPGARCDSESLHVLLLVRPGPDAGVGVERQVPRAAGDPALPQPRGRPLRPAPQHRSSTRGSPPPTSNETTDRWEIETDQGDKVTAKYLITGIGCLSSGQVPNITGRDTLPGRLVPHRRLAPRGRRLHRQAGGRDRHRLQRRPVDPGDRQDRPSHLYVFQRTPQYTIPARHGTVDKAFLDEVKKDYDDDLREGPLVRRRPALSTRSSARRSTVSDEERRAIYEDGLGAGRLQVPLRLVQRHRRRPPGQRHGVGVHPLQDPRHREGPRGRREAGARRPPVHVQAGPDRHRLLRHLQPRQRDAGRHPPRADRRRSPRPGIRTEDGEVRPRHHRVRHRLRRHDRHLQPDRHPGPGRREAEGQVGRRARRPTSACRRPGSPTCS